MALRKYRLRAECLADVLGLLEVVGAAVECATIARVGELPDVVAELHCPRLTLPTLQVFCRLLDGSGPDGQNVMLETVNTAAAFTGERQHEGFWADEPKPRGAFSV